MPVEIERKFLVINDAWRSLVTSSESMKQGYLSSANTCSIRIRMSQRGAWLNIKSKTLDARRLEFEYQIPTEDAEHMFGEFCKGPRIEKERYYVDVGKHTWEIDVFGGDNDGLIVAEVELSDENEAFERPSWLGAEVTDDERYYNIRLASHPYGQWSGDSK